MGFNSHGPLEDAIHEAEEKVRQLHKQKEREYCLAHAEAYLLLDEDSKRMFVLKHGYAFGLPRETFDKFMEIVAKNRVKEEV